MKKKIYLLLFCSILFILGINKVNAGSITCKYKKDNITYTYKYEYGTQLQYFSSNKSTHPISYNNLKNADFFDKNSKTLVCPKIQISKTPKEKGRYKVSITKKADGVSASVSGLKEDGKEKEKPISNNNICTYEPNKVSSYTLTMVDGKVKVGLDTRISDYNPEVNNCTSKHFENGKCPEVYDQIIAKGKRLIIDCENKILTENDKKNEASKNENVDTGEKNENGNSNSQDLVDGDQKYECDIIPEGIKKWIKNILSLVKYVALVIVIVLGTMDFIKAAASGEPDAMKKAGQSFIKRVIAVIILFLLPMLVDLILGLVELYGANSTCIE